MPVVEIMGAFLGAALTISSTIISLERLYLLLNKFLKLLLKVSLLIKIAWGDFFFLTLPYKKLLRLIPSNKVCYR
jgi:hypothetical protein